MQWVLMKDITYFKLDVCFHFQTTSPSIIFSRLNLNTLKSCVQSQSQSYAHFATAIARRKRVSRGQRGISTSNMS